MASEQFFEADAASAAQARRARDDPERDAVGAQVGHEGLECLEGERPGTPPVADASEDGMVVAKTGHVRSSALLGGVRFGARFAGAVGPQGTLRERPLPATPPKVVRGHIGVAEPPGAARARRVGVGRAGLP